jgi:hypothetical protein
MGVKGIDLGRAIHLRRGKAQVDRVTTLASLGCTPAAEPVPLCGLS